MKKSIISALLLAALTVGLTYFGQAPASGESPPSAEVQIPEAVSDSKRNITLLVGSEPVKICVEDYLVGVVAAESPASFEPEALKAQAVAARSFMQYCMEQGAHHEDADMCSDFSCCQAWLSDDELKARWGDKYEKYAKKIRDAVNSTDGEYICYDGKAALAVFHSSSDGKTEASGEIWGELPYLKSVDTPETAEDVPNFVSSVSMSELDFRDTILYLKPEADMTGDADSWVQDISLDDAGRVKTAVIGGISFTGQELRQLFSLRSAAFALSHNDGMFNFTVAGYGHGVGMSQYGANVLAKQGMDYREILSHYYPGTSLSCLK